jgi:hypothetical protein
MLDAIMAIFPVIWGLHCQRMATGPRFLNLRQVLELLLACALPNAKPVDYSPNRKSVYKG